MKKDIEMIAKSRRFAEIVRNICPKNPDDLKQEVMLVLLGQTKQRIEYLVSEDKLMAFAVSVAWRQARGERTAFGRIGRLQRRTAGVSDRILEVLAHTPEAGNHRVLDALEDIIHNPSEDDWYDINIVRQTIELGSMMEVKRQTGIPYQSIVQAFRRGKEKIKKQLESIIHHTG